MKDNVKIARQLIAMARELVGMAKPSDGFGGNDPDNTNAQYYAQYKRIVRSLYPSGVAEKIIMCGEGLDRRFPMHGSMGNGNIVLNYNEDPRRKELIIQALVSEKHRIMPSDIQDIMTIYKLLKEKVDSGYAILTDCNTHSITFLATFADKNGYHFHGDDARMAFGDTGDEGDLSRLCICCRKDDPRALGNNNANDFTKDRTHLNRLVDEEEKKMKKRKK